MTKYILRRLVTTIPVLIGISIIVFLLVRLVPGDAIDMMLGSEGTMAPEVRAMMRKTLGLDEPIHAQYAHWAWGILQGDLGISLRNSEPVLRLLLSRLPVTLELAFLSVVVSLVMALPLGIASAVKRNSRTDFLVRIIGLIGLSFPNFWLATMLILFTSLYFNWIPPIMFISIMQDPMGNLSQMALPSISLAAAMTAVSMRMTRSAMLEVLRAEYIRTARAKGLRELVVLYRHALKNAMIPVITVVGIQLGNLLGGAVIVEQVFGLPGVGWMVLNGIYQRDYPVVQGAVLFLALMFVLVNLVVDVLYACSDPRIRYS